MNEIVLQKDLQDLVDAEVSGGFAADAQSVVNAALRSYFRSLADLRASINDAREDYARNGGKGLAEVRAEFEARWKRDAG